MDFINLLATTDFDWCAPDSGLIKVFRIIIICLNIIRVVVPIGLIFMCILDISKNIINPEEKDSMKKIGSRVIAAVIVFLIPTIVRIVLGIVDIALGEGASSDNSLIDCWNAASQR